MILNTLRLRPTCRILIVFGENEDISRPGLSQRCRSTRDVFPKNDPWYSRSGLKETHSIMIAGASVSKALFGDEDPLNKTITINNSARDVTVTGVYEDFPLNTKFHKVKYFTSWGFFLLNNPWIEKSMLNNWREHSFHIYVEIRPGLFSNFLKT